LQKSSGFDNLTEILKGIGAATLGDTQETEPCENSVFASFVTILGLPLEYTIAALAESRLIQSAQSHPYPSLESSGQAAFAVGILFRVSQDLLNFS
jgi:hypothetical protein